MTAARPDPGRSCAALCGHPEVSLRPRRPAHVHLSSTRHSGTASCPLSSGSLRTRGSWRGARRVAGPLLARACRPRRAQHPARCSPAPRPSATCHRPRSPSRPSPFLEIPSSCAASRREPQNPDNRTPPPQTRSRAPQDWPGGARAPLRMCAMRAAESHATPPSDRLPPLGSDTTRAVGNFLNLARTRSPPQHPRAAGRAPQISLSGARQVFVSCGSRRACPGAESRVGPAREAGRWARGWERRAEAALAHSRTLRAGRLPVALRSLVLS